MTEVYLPDDPGAWEMTSLDLSVPGQQNRSIWTGRRQIIGLPGAEVWAARISIVDITTEEQERAWRAFLLSLRGQQNWFRLPLPCNRHYGPKPLVNAATGDGYSLPLDGMAPSTRILRAGQFMTVPLPSGHWRTVGLTADLVTNSSGQATAQFEPALNEVPANNAVVETGDPFIPVSNADAGFSLAYSQAVSGTELSLVENL